MLEDSESVAVITTSDMEANLRSLLPSQSTTVVVLDKDQAAINQQEAEVGRGGSAGGLDCTCWCLLDKRFGSRPRLLVFSWECSCQWLWLYSCGFVSAGGARVNLLALALCVCFVEFRMCVLRVLALSLHFAAVIVEQTRRTVFRAPYVVGMDPPGGVQWTIEQAFCGLGLMDVDGVRRSQLHSVLFAT